MIQKFAKILFAFLFLSTCSYGYTQSLDQAKILYNEGKYGEAKPVFEKLVRQSPNNSSYNQWYGVCCYETGDFENAEKHLLIANKRKVMESYRYLACLYMDMYRFDKAAEMWEGYIDLQKKKKEDIKESEIKLEQAQNLHRMQEKTEDIQVIDSITIDKETFLNTYSLSEESGNMTYYNNFFDVPEAVSSVVYQNQKGDKIYYARPSESGVYAIYCQSKLLDAWGDEKILVTDNSYDNNYPFVLSDGVTMYFSSKGNGSIGGYDIFVTRYNTNTNSYLTPEQMGMPFNSPANDYMMIIDETKGLGWFASDRNQPEDKICAYLFIPDPSRKRIGDMEDPDVLIKRAALTSIKDTWKEGVNYTDLIALAHKDLTTKEKKEERDFIFVVNDKTTYYTLNEIKSHEAKEFYSEVISLNKQIKSLDDKINETRSSYSKGNASVREQLKPTILQAENQLYRLMEKAGAMEKKARNAENIRTGYKY
ncbi:MAG: tetratricopeptide repeat protein [Tannerella sp.]|jgi:tetratricopeptide (TPR) repeat protein|nr:tetratricopeptide repeat protein [Tannerella sp.]